MALEHTLVIFKPDAVQRGVVGELLSRFERVGLKLVATKMLQPTKEQLHHHYEGIGKLLTRRGKVPFEVTMSFMQSGPVIAIVLEGDGAADIVRKMVGTTEPKSALPGTIRGDYSHISFGYADANKVGIPNLVHASGNAEEAKLEIAHWFQNSEIVSYSACAQRFTQPA